jgi:hypothetical protein
MSHTPAPWEAVDDGILASDGEVEVAIAPLRDGVNPTEWQANMRLIAAAPELLLALDLVLGIGRKDHGNPKYDGIYATARAAIVKAEGR